MNKHTHHWIEILNSGDEIGHKSRTKSNLITEENPLPILRGTAKDHKPCPDLNVGPDMRPIMGACVGPNTGLSQIGCEIIRKISNSVKVRYDIKSTEEMLAKIQEYNKSNDCFKPYRKVFASLDIKNFYTIIKAEMAVGSGKGACLQTSKKKHKLGLSWAKLSKAGTELG